MNLKKIIVVPLILILVAAAIVLLIINIVSEPKSQGFTELYFFGDMPKVVNMDKSYVFSFAIHNLEDENQLYNYEISMLSNRLNHGRLSLDPGEVAIVYQSFLIRNKTTFSDLYMINEFPDSQGKIRLTGEEDLNDIIYGLENEDISGNHTIFLESNNILRGYVYLVPTKPAVINRTSLREGLVNTSIPISVELVNKDQEIHFWALIK